MNKKKKRKSKKINISKKNFIIIGLIVLFIILVIAIKLIFFLNVYVGKIAGGKIVYVDNIENVTIGSNDNIIITFKKVHRLLDSCIVTTNDTYKDLIDKNKKYQLPISKYLKETEISNKEIYNIQKALELKMINDKTKYSDYLAITCGFKNEKELIKNIEAIKKLNEKDD